MLIFEDVLLYHFSFIRYNQSPSVRPSVRQLVSQSVRPFVRPSVSRQTVSQAVSSVTLGQSAVGRS